MFHSSQDIRDRIELLKELNFQINSEEVLRHWFPERLNQQLIRSKKPKLAGVSILIYPLDNELHIALMQRDNYPGVHSNQISLPGGKMEEIDSDIWETAKRETQEEFGIDLGEIIPLWELSQVYIPPSNFLVSPFLNLLEARPNFTTNYEVKELIELPLSSFLNKSNIKKGIIPTGHGNLIETRYFQIEDHIIWGATALILGELHLLLTKELKK